MNIPNGSLVALKMRPDAAVEAALKALQDPTLKKNALFDLRETLKVHISALQTAMTFDFGWDSLPVSFVDKLLSLSGMLTRYFCTLNNSFRQHKSQCREECTPYSVLHV